MATTPRRCRNAHHGHGTAVSDGDPSTAFHLSTRWPWRSVAVEGMEPEPSTFHPSPEYAGSIDATPSSHEKPTQSPRNHPPPLTGYHTMAMPARSPRPRYGCQRWRSIHLPSPECAGSIDATPSSHGRHTHEAPGSIRRH